MDIIKKDKNQIFYNHENIHIEEPCQKEERTQKITENMIVLFKN